MLTKRHKDISRVSPALWRRYGYHRVFASRMPISRFCRDRLCGMWQGNREGDMNSSRR